MNDDKDLAVIEIVTKAFGTEFQKATITQSTFKKAGFTFSDIQTALNRFASPTTFSIVHAPKSVTDKAPYVLQPTEEFKKFTTEMQTGMLKMRDTQLLRIYYSRVLDIFEAMLGGLVGYEDPQLNHYYTYLTIEIDAILEKDDFKELKADMPDLPESLLGSFEDLDMAWEFLQPQMRGFLGKLERRWITLRLPEFDLSEPEQQLLDLTDEAVAQHRKLRAKAHEQFDKQAEQDAARIREQMVGNDSDAKKQQTKPPTPTDKPIKKIQVHQLMPQHYSGRTGVLTLSPTDRVEIAKRGKVRRSNGKKYDQCWLMECLFKTVNTLNNGITFSTFLSVKYDKTNKKHIKKIRNTIVEINKKVADKGVPKKLIFSQGEKIFIDKSYL